LFNLLPSSGIIQAKMPLAATRHVMPFCIDILFIKKNYVITILLEPEVTHTAHAREHELAPRWLAFKNLLNPHRSVRTILERQVYRLAVQIILHRILKR